MLQYTYFASEIYTALEFTEPGLYTMVVNSDDCFATTSGPSPLDTFTAAQLGRFDAPAGRGSADTSFQLHVQATIVDGPSPVDTASVSLMVDGAPADATISKTDTFPGATTTSILIPPVVVTPG